MLKCPNSRLGLTATNREGLFGCSFMARFSGNLPLIMWSGGVRLFTGGGAHFVLEPDLKRVE
jgi:hypothetical protein